MCAMDEPPCSPWPSPPLQPSLLSALLSSSWKGPIQPPCPPCCWALASLQGPSALPPKLPHARVQLGPSLGRGSSLLWLLLSAFILLLPQGQQCPHCVPVLLEGRAGMGKRPAKPAPCPCSWCEK